MSCCNVGVYHSVLLILLRLVVLLTLTPAIGDNLPADIIHHRGIDIPFFSVFLHQTIKKIAQIFWIQKRPLFRDLMY